VGYVVSTPLTAQAHEPIIQAMLRAYPVELPLFDRTVGY
jgi:methylglyoxal synthase